MAPLKADTDDDELGDSHACSIALRKAHRARSLATVWIRSVFGHDVSVPLVFTHY